MTKIARIKENTIPMLRMEQALKGKISPTENDNEELTTLYRKIRFLVLRPETISDHKTSITQKGFVAPVEEKTVFAKTRLTLSSWFKVVEATSQNLNLESANKQHPQTTSSGRG